MKLGIMQPYFLPYIGYWQLIKNVDKYIVYDDVNYRRGWINRNQILLNGKPKLFTISLKEGSQNKKINEILINDDFNKFMKTLQFCYSKSPYFENVYALLHSICSYEDQNLGSFIFNSIQKICNYLGITTELILSSQIQINNELKGKDRILYICKQMQATEYYNAIGGQELYDKMEFVENGIDLQFVKTDAVEYKQFGSDFVPNLSIIDVLMFNSVGEVNMMLDKYTLI